MWWTAGVAIACSVFVISLLLGYAVLRLRRYKAEQLLRANMKNDQRYLLVSSPNKKCKPTTGIPYSSSEPVNIQPHPKTLRSMDLSMLTDENLNNMSLQPMPEFQVPLISHYETNTSTMSRKNKKRRSIQESYGPASSKVIETPTIVISQEADTNANFANIQSNGKPELTFSIFYDAPSKDLHITVINASNLPVLGSFQAGTQYFRVRVRVGVCSTQLYETRYACGTRAPVFGETFIVSGLVHHKLRECTVRFVVIEYEELQHCWTVVGEVHQTLIDLRANSLLKLTKTLHKT